MPRFRYVAKDVQGRTSSGNVFASNEGEAVGQLRAQNLVILNLREEAGRKQVTAAGARPRFGIGGVGLDDMVLFTRQMATMVSSGIPLLEALEIMVEQVTNKYFSAVIERIVDQVRAGSDLSSALMRYPKIFPAVYTNMVKAGEASGQLDVILARLADYMESTAELRRRIRTAMTYPVVALTMILMITSGLMIFVVPQFSAIFSGLGVDLPGITSFVLALSMAMRHNILGILLGLVVVVIVLVLYVRTPTGRRQKDWLKLNAPIFGPLFQKVSISRFSKTFATLIRSGVPILGALEIVAGTSGNQIITDAVLNSRENVRRGETLAEPLGESGVFPPMVTRMIAIGEKSGALEELLEKISEFYDAQVAAAVEGLTSLIEPLLILVMGIMVGSIVLSVFLPILRIQEVLRGE